MRPCGVKLTSSDIRMIRKAWADRTMTIAEIAKLYGVRNQTVYNIVRGKTHKEA